MKFNLYLNYNKKKKHTHTQHNRVQRYIEIIKNQRNRLTYHIDISVYELENILNNTY